MVESSCDLESGGKGEIVGVTEQHGVIVDRASNGSTTHKRFQIPVEKSQSSL
jgi:hypothetical protein